MEKGKEMVGIVQEFDDKRCYGAIIAELTGERYFVHRKNIDIGSDEDEEGNRLPPSWKTLLPEQRVSFVLGDAYSGLSVDQKMHPDAEPTKRKPQAMKVKVMKDGDEGISGSESISDENREAVTEL